MTDYLPLLTRAVSNLGNNPEGRRAVYDRARQALVAQLRAMNPPLAEAEITRERLALEEAIRRVEAQTAKSEPPAGLPPGPPVSPPRAPVAPSPSSPLPAAQRPAPRAPVPPRPNRSAPPPAVPQEQPEEPVSGSRVVRDAVAGAKELGAAAAEAGRSAREAMGALKPDEPFELEQLPESADDVHGRDAARPGVGEPMSPRAGRVRSVDYAKVEARRAMKARLIVGSIVGALLLVAILIGYVNRERILASIGLGSGPTPARIQQTEGPKAPDRVAPTEQAETRAPTQPSQTSPAAAVAQRAVLYEENPGTGEQQLQTFVGTAVWRTETVNPGPGRPPELGLRVEVEIPDRKMTVKIAIRRNPDQTLPASHTVEVQFVTPNDPFGGVANMPGIRAKTTETAQGAPLVGLVVRVMPGFFLVGLSAIDADREQNLSLLRERGWLDVPFVYNNGRRAVLVIEKGTPGERAVNEVIAAWGG